jgi:hypothetical protein
MNRPTTLLLGAAALTMPFALGAQTLDLPPRKAGLWDISTMVEKPAGMPAITAQMCLDPNTDRDLMDHALNLTGGNCKSVTTKREGKTLVLAAECTFGGKATRSRTVISGDFQSAYTARTEGTMDRGSKGPQSTVTTQTATWKSADCPGMKPGDITMFGGVKVNVKQLKALSGLIR